MTSTICCLDANSGALLWEQDGGGLPGPVVAGDCVYFGSSESPFFTCVERLAGPDGQPVVRWQFNLFGRVWESTAAIINHKAIILSDSGYVYAIR